MLYSCTGCTHTATVGVKGFRNVCSIVNGELERRVQGGHTGVPVIRRQRRGLPGVFYRCEMEHS